MVKLSKAIHLSYFNDKQIHYTDSIRINFLKEILKSND